MMTIKDRIFIPDDDDSGKLIFGGISKIVDLHLLQRRSNILINLPTGQDFIKFFEANRGIFPEEEKISSVTTPADDFVAKTVWILWKDDHEKVWEIIFKWSNTHDILLPACNRIIKMGLSYSYFTIEQVFKKIEVLLLDGDKDKTKAASSLLFAIPLKFLIDTTSEWRTIENDNQSNALTIFMLHIFRNNPSKCLNVLIHWANNGENIFDEVIANVLEKISEQPNNTTEFHKSILKQLFVLKSILVKHNKRANQSILKVIKLAKDKISKNINKAIHKESSLKNYNRKNTPRVANK
jgi:hypothetical protein